MILTFWDSLTEYKNQWMIWKKYFISLSLLLPLQLARISAVDTLNVFRNGKCFTTWLAFPHFLLSCRTYSVFGRSEKGKFEEKKKRNKHRCVEKVEPESEASTKMWACEQNWENEIFRNDITRATEQQREMRRDEIDSPKSAQVDEMRLNVAQHDNVVWGRREKTRDGWGEELLLAWYFKYAHAALNSGWQRRLKSEKGKRQQRYSKIEIEFSNKVNENDGHRWLDSYQPWGANSEEFETM